MGRYSVMRYKTKRRERDLDQIYADMSTKESIFKLKNQPLDETKPGLGQFYCIECAKYFENQPAIDTHTKTKIHKRRLKLLSEKPYTNLEAEASIGLNLKTFTESVENYKKIEQYKKENEIEITEIKNVKKDIQEMIDVRLHNEKTASVDADDKIIVDEN